MIEFDCIHCQKPIRLSDDKAGLTGSCPHCSELVVVPSDETKQLHDDAFTSKKAASEPIEIWDVSTLSKPQGIREHSVVILSNLAGWIFGLIFFICFVISVGDHPAVSLIALIGALLLIPPAYKKISLAFKKSISTKSKVSSAVILYILFSGLYSYALSNSAANDKAASDLREAQLQIQKDNLAANKAAILKKATELLDSEKPSEALEVMQSYQELGDPDVNSITAKAQQKIKIIADSMRQNELLNQLKKIPAPDLEERSKIYQELTTLAPGNAEFKKQSSVLSEQVSQLAAKQKAEQLASADLQARRAQGLVWRYSTSQDDMSLKKISNAEIDSTNRMSFSFPYANPQRATLQLRKHPRWGSDVILMIERGQFLCNDYDGCSVLVRFGKGNPQRFSASGPSDNSTNYIFIRDYKNFVNQIRKTDEVTIEAKFYQEGNRAMKFATDGLDWN